MESSDQIWECWADWYCWEVSREEGIVDLANFEFLKIWADYWKISADFGLLSPLRSVMCLLCLSWIWIIKGVLFAIGSFIWRYFSISFWCLGASYFGIMFILGFGLSTALLKCEFTRQWPLWWLSYIDCMWDLSFPFFYQSRFMFKLLMSQLTLLTCLDFKGDIALEVGFERDTKWLLPIFCL